MPLKGIPRASFTCNIMYSKKNPRKGEPSIVIPQKSDAPS